jgi:multisubunit Na+/H+ antiporter MnhE subunit
MPHRGRRLAGELIGWWVLLFLLYLVFISTLSPLELIVGAAASAVAGVGAWAIHRAVRPDVGPAGHWTAAVRVWPGTLLMETVRLARLTLAGLRGRPTQGRFATVRLRAGVGTAWACSLLSGTPGSCVMAVDAHPGAAPVLIVHSLFDSRSRLESVLTEADEA